MVCIGFENINQSSNAQETNVNCVFVMLSECLLFWYGFITGRTQNFNAASVERKHIKKAAYKVLEARTSLR